MLYDINERKSVISYDRYSDRIDLIKLNDEESDYIIEILEKVAKVRRYSKISAKISYRNRESFLKKGYTIEARIPNLYRGNEDGLFLAKYFSVERETVRYKEIINKVIHEAAKNRNKNKYCRLLLREDLMYRLAREKELDELVDFYRRNIKSRLLSVFDYKYIEDFINNDTVYGVICNKEKIIAAVACEVDRENLNAEMTNFAGDENFRGKGLARYLAISMEEEMKKIGIKTLYSVVRARSFDANILFSKIGFKLSGTLINNTNISGRIECMNVWYKEI